MAKKRAKERVKQKNKEVEGKIKFVWLAFLCLFFTTNISADRLNPDNPFGSTTGSDSVALDNEYVKVMRNATVGTSTGPKFLGPG